MWKRSPKQMGISGLNAHAFDLNRQTRRRAKPIMLLSEAPLRLILNSWLRILLP